MAGLFKGREMKQGAKAEKQMPNADKMKKMANGGMAMKYADGGKVMKYADGGMAGGCGHRGAQDYGKKR